MKFLIDAHLPRQMTRWLAAAGCNAIHTSELPAANRTVDAEINDLAERENRVVVTKDADFVDSHMLHGRPPKLLLISTGNLKNAELESLMKPLIASIILEFRTCSFLELGRDGLYVRA